MSQQDSKGVPGFSIRFCEFLERAGVTQKGRTAIGSERCKVTRGTFSLWCSADQPPRSYPDLIRVISVFLDDIPGEYDPHAVAYWLHAGDLAPNPFEEIAVDNILKGDIYILLDSAKRRSGVQLSAKQINKISLDIYNHVCEQRRRGLCSDSIRDNHEIMRLINSYINVESSLIRA